MDLRGGTTARGMMALAILVIIQFEETGKAYINTKFYGNQHSNYECFLLAVFFGFKYIFLAAFFRFVIRFMNS